MNRILHELTEEYSSALQAFLSGAGESALSRAYEIGRRAISAGLGPLELAAAHHEVLTQALAGEGDRASIVAAAGLFFSETFSPFEMTQRGFRDSVAALKKRAEDLDAANRHLAASEARFRAVAESAQDSIVSADSTGHILYFNPAAERSFGYRAQDVVGKPLVMLMPERFHEPHLKGLRRYLETGEKRILGRTVEVAAKRKDGSEFPAEISLASWRTDGGAMFTAIIRDLTERKKAEEERARLSAQLLQGQKLQAIGQLAAGVAHEINNPVSYILSNVVTISEYFADFLRLLEKTQDGIERIARGEDPVPIRQEIVAVRDEIDADFLIQDLGNALKDCREGAERIREIVKSLKDFAHPDEGMMKPSDINAGLESTIRVCWNELKYKAEVHQDYGQLPSVPCYPQRINQVFMNLLVNAAQAIHDKGEIFVSTRVEGDFAVIRIRDTGVGIPKQNLPRIFEPFFTTKPVGKGTGLGLHVAYKVVKAHGGDITVHSESGQGTEFTVKLPLQPPGP